MPVRMIVREPALLRYLRQLGLQFLQAHHVRPLALQPLPRLGRAGPYPVDIPGGDFHAWRARRITFVAMPAERAYVPVMPPAAPLTAEELLARSIPDKRLELVRGVLIVREPAGYAHGRVAMNLAVRLATYVESATAGQVFAAQTGFTLARGPDTVRAPAGSCNGPPSPSSSSPCSRCRPRRCLTRRSSSTRGETRSTAAL